MIQSSKHNKHNNSHSNSNNDTQCKITNRNHSNTSSTQQRMCQGICEPNNIVLDAQIATHTIERSYHFPLFTPGCKTRNPSKFRLTFARREIGFECEALIQYMDEDTGIFHYLISCDIQPKNKQYEDGEFYVIPIMEHPIHNIIGKCELPIMRLVVFYKQIQITIMCFGIENGSRSRIVKSDKYMRKIFGYTYTPNRISQQTIYQQILIFGSNRLENYLDISPTTTCATYNNHNTVSSQ